MLLVKRNHVRPGLEESLDPLFVVVIAQLGAQISADPILVLDEAGSLRERIAGYPHPAARPRGRAAEHRLLFDNDDFQSVECRRHRSGKPARAGAEG